jgi:hypothetical protein
LNNVKNVWGESGANTQ